MSDRETREMAVKAANMLEKMRSLSELGWVFTVEYDNTIALFGVWARRDNVAYGRYDIRLERAIMDVLEVIG